MLTDEQIRATMRDLAQQKVKQVWVHPRPGLMTPYLSDEWFQLWKVALDEAKRLDMNVWIYDENSYPERVRRRLGAGTDAGVARTRLEVDREQSHRRRGKPICSPSFASKTARPKTLPPR